MTASTPPEATSGAPDILRLAIPAFGALVAQPLFTLIDAAIVATLGTTSLAALGAAAQVFATVTGAAVFLAYGTTAVVARRVGAGQQAAGITAGVEGMALGLVLGSAALLVTWLAAPALLAAIGTSPQATPLAVTYLRIVSLAFPFALTAMAAVGVLRGLQDTRTTMWVTVASVALNAVLASWWVLGMHWGIAGSAWATVLAEVFAAVAFVAAILRRAREPGSALRPTGSGVLGAARLAVPLFWRTVAIRAVFLIAIAVAARIGDVELAAYYVTFTVWYVLALAMDALGIAGQALLGRYLGAGAARAARRVTWQLTRWGVLLGVVLMIAVLLVRPWLPDIFGSEPAVRTMVAGALLVVAAQQPLAGVVFVLDGVLLGAGDAKFLMWAQAAALAGFAPAALAVAWLAANGQTPSWFGPGQAVTGLWLALTVFMLVRAIAFLGRVRGDGWLVLGAKRG